MNHAAKPITAMTTVAEPSARIREFFSAVTESGLSMIEL
jgi:hypothetical protein